MSSGDSWEDFDVDNFQLNSTTQTTNDDPWDVPAPTATQVGLVNLPTPTAESISPRMRARADLKDSYRDLGLQSVDLVKLQIGSARERAVHPDKKYRDKCVVYATWESLMAAGQDACPFPHIVVHFKKDGSLKQVHLTAVPGGSPHSNPHIWYYPGRTALFADATSYRLRNEHQASDFQLLEAFLDAAFGLNARLSYLYQREYKGRYFPL